MAKKKGKNKQFLERFVGQNFKVGYEQWLFEPVNLQ